MPRRAVSLSEPVFSELKKQAEDWKCSQGKAIQIMLRKQQWLHLKKRMGFSVYAIKGDQKVELLLVDVDEEVPEYK